jgi:hypothetical protein
VGPLDALWHLLNLIAPAVGTAAIASALAKLLWRRDLRGASWPRLFGCSATAGIAALLAGLVVFGADGRMVTYAAMSVACALALWAAGFLRHSA